MLQDKDITYQMVEADLVKDGKIKGLVKLSTPNVIDIWLKKGHYILTGDSAHYFCIVANMGDKWKIQDSQGTNFADK